MALGDAQSRAAAEQVLRDIRAQKSAAADQHDELAFQGCAVSHGLLPIQPARGKFRTPDAIHDLRGRSWRMVRWAASRSHNDRVIHPGSGLDHESGSLRQLINIETSL